MTRKFSYRNYVSFAVIAIVLPTLGYAAASHHHFSEDRYTQSILSSTAAMTTRTHRAAETVPRLKPLPAVEAAEWMETTEEIPVRKINRAPRPPMNTNTAVFVPKGIPVVIETPGVLRLPQAVFVPPTRDREPR